MYVTQSDSVQRTLTSGPRGWPARSSLLECGSSTRILWIPTNSLYLSPSGVSGFCLVEISHDITSEWMIPCLGDHLSSGT
jgi:hypothetical protein